MGQIKTLSCDIETYSTTNLARAGVYKYAESSDFEVLLFAYVADGGDVKVVDLASGEYLPGEIRKALTDDSVIKWAFNAQFERVCLSHFLGEWLKPAAWRCTMVWSAYLGLPLSLEGVGTVLGLEKQKLREGKDPIRHFSMPCKPTKTNGHRIRNQPRHDPEKWGRFKEYNRRDVEAEIAIQQRLARFPVPQAEWQNYILDQQINDRGVLLDRDLVRVAIDMDNQTKAELIEAMQKTTGLENPNSVAQLKEWLNEQGIETESLNKAAVKELLQAVPEPVCRVLEMRQALAKSSVAKYAAMENVVCGDGRARGLIQFYGANRTGRFAGRLIQIQNLPRNHLPDLKQARALVKSGDRVMVDALYDSVPFVLSQLIRTAFVPKPGLKFIVADFSSIERVVLAWLAGERWVLDAYRAKKDLYIATASQMFRVPIEQIDKRDPLRQKGKVADLACGYGGSVGALKAMGALGLGLAEDELRPLVESWRAANPRITQFWWAVDRAAMTAVRERTNTETHGIRFTYRSGMLFITLPSGRNLSYVKPRIGTNKFGGACVTYEGVGTARRWERQQSYGPKFVENIVQAISRDLLCHAMHRLDRMGLSIVAHVHDEVVIEAPDDVSLEIVCRQMAITPPWAPGLPLRADGFECDFYQTD